MVTVTCTLYRDIARDKDREINRYGDRDMDRDIARYKDREK